jgi:hypothetical protein
LANPMLWFFLSLGGTPNHPTAIPVINHPFFWGVHTLRNPHWASTDTFVCWQFWRPFFLRHKNFRRTQKLVVKPKNGCSHQCGSCILASPVGLGMTNLQRASAIGTQSSRDWTTAGRGYHLTVAALTESWRDHG